MILNPSAAFDRALAFVRDLDRRASTRVEQLPFGAAYLRPELPRVWSRNFVWVDVPPERLDTAELTGTAERVHAEAGLVHRRLAFAHEASAGAAAARLAPQGWLPGRVLVMPHRGPAAAPEPPPGGREVDTEAVRPLKRAILRLDPQTRKEDTTRQLLEAYDVLGDLAAERSFAYEIGGEVVASCRLYSDGATAQIEDVGTLPSHRQHGFGNAVVLLALKEAWAAHAFVFIEAEAGDWPKDWYARAGFETAGAVCDLTRHPQSPE